MESQAQSNDLRDILSKKTDINMVNVTDTVMDTTVEKEEYVPSENMKHLMQMMDDESKEVVDSILQGDKIEEIKIIGEVPENATIDNLVESWNTILDKNN